MCLFILFLGNKAMISGSLEYFRKGEWPKTNLEILIYMKDFIIKHKEVAALMQNTTIINDFKCKWFHFKSHENEYLTGPTGHKYLVNKGTF
jgi:hypothetical protein